MATGDEDASIRDLTTRLLGTLPEEPGSIAVLVAVSAHDKAWNVRYQAVAALRRFPDNADAAQAVQAARSDPDERIAKLASR